jgi:hypothetical protein
MTAAPTTSTVSKTTTWQEEFLKLLPMIQRHARFAFRDLDPEAQEEAVCEVVASSLCAYRRLCERGETDRAYGSALARYAVARYRSGRRVGASQCAHDVYSTLAKEAGGFTLCSLNAPDEGCGQWMEALIDSHRTRVPDQVGFRLDLPQWLSRQTPRNRRIAERLSLGYSTSEVAHEFRISPGRISQLQTELAESWNAFVNPAAKPLGVTGLSFA